MLGLTAHGGNRVLVALANALVQAGHSCTVLTPRQPTVMPAMPYAFDPRVQVRRVGIALVAKPLRWLLFSAYLAWALRGRDVIANHFLTAVAARLASFASDARVIYLVQDIEYRFYAGLTRALARALCLWTYRLPSVLPANPYLEDELRKHGAKPLPAASLGIDAIFLEQIAQGKDKQFDVIYFLRRERHKRSDRFADIARRLQPAKLRIAAISQDAALLGEYAPLLAQSFMPASDGELIEILDRSRVLLLTSDQEGFALPPLEAMARGLPCVLFPCGGPGTYAQNGHNCVVIENESTATAAEAIVHLLGDGGEYAKLAANARATAARFNLATSLAEILPRLQALLPEGHC